MVFNAEAVDGLVHAYRPGTPCSSPDRTVALIKDRIRRLAAGPRLALARPAAEPVQLVRRDLRRDGAGQRREQGARTRRCGGTSRASRRALAGARGGAGNFGAGMRFHYLPERPAGASDERGLRRVREHRPQLHALLRPGPAGRHAAPPGRPAAAASRNWIRRAIAGYWTHSGYLNWDSGLGFARWHQGKKLGLAQLALIGIARSGELAPSPAWRAQAKWLLDRSLTWYDRMAGADGRHPAGAAVRRLHRAGRPGQRGPGRRPRGGERGARRRGRARQRGRRADPAGAVRLRPRHRPAGRHDAPLQHRDRRRTTRARSPTAGSSWRGSTTASRTSRRTSAGRPPAAFGVVARRPDGRVLLASQSGRSGTRGPRAPHARPGGRRRVGRDAERAGRRVHRSAGGRDGPRRRRQHHEPLPLHPRVDRGRLVGAPSQSPDRLM